MMDWNHAADVQSVEDCGEFGAFGFGAYPMGLGTRSDLAKR